MALSIRRSSDWSVVLVTDKGQQISFDRENRRISANLPRRTSKTAKDLSCPLCHQLLSNSFAADAQSQCAESPEAGASSFVHPEYFGLLATCLEEEDVIDLEDDSPDDHLSTESFNQGYCKRFFVEEGPLGKGGKGEVVKVRHVLEGISLGEFALKRVPVGNSQAWLIKMLREVQSLRFKHPNLVSYNHVWLEHSQRSFGPRIPVLHILQEYCDGGDLESYVFSQCGKEEPTIEQLKERTRRRSRGHSPRPIASPGLSVATISSFFQDILAGVAFLHEQGMIHRDMKSSNCLIDTKVLSETGLPRVLVSDFGEAQFVNSKVERRSGGTGTLSYTSPEIVRGGPWTAAADMFSIGMILYFLTHEGNLPYQSSSDDFDGLREEILRFNGFPSSLGPVRLNKEDKRDLESVLALLLSPEPEKRPSCANLIALMHLHERAGDTPARPDASSRHSSKSHKREGADYAWPPVLQVNQTLALPSRQNTFNNRQTLLRSNSQSLVKSRADTSLLTHALGGKGEFIILAILLSRYVIVQNAIGFRTGSTTFVLMFLALLQIVESKLSIPTYGRLYTTLALALLAWMAHFYPSSFTS